MMTGFNSVPEINMSTKEKRTRAVKFWSVDACFFYHLGSLYIFSIYIRKCKDHSPV